jgi:activator of HSP90 ATPase
MSEGARHRTVTAINTGEGLPMISTLISRRALTVGLGTIPAGLAAARVFGASDTVTDAGAGTSNGLSHSSESIHQELTFKASRRQVYEALTSTSRFDALTRLSDGLSLLTAPGAKATAISRDVGGPFTLFGGYITGRHLELMPDELLVQAWRAGGWKPGDYSIVKFVLSAEATACKLVLEHRGFPEGQGKSLAYGWGVHYWEPLAKLLAQG